MIKSHLSHKKILVQQMSKQKYMWQKLVLLSENYLMAILSYKVLFILQTINWVLYSAFCFQCIAEVSVAK